MTLKTLATSIYDKLLRSHARLDGLFASPSSDATSPDDVIGPKCLKSVATALDNLTSQAILACKLLREENRLLRKERKLMLLEGEKCRGYGSNNSMVTGDEQNRLIKEMNE